MKKLFYLTILASVILVSCKKYEEDSGIHLKTAKTRMCNDWSLAAYYLNGKDSTAAYHAIAPNMVFSLNKNGNFTQTAKYSGFTFTRTGSWQFTNGKEQLSLYETSPNIGTTTFKIRKLTSSEFWLLNISGTNEEYHLQRK